MPGNKFAMLVREFIDSDIPVAEIIDPPNYKIGTVIANINRTINTIGYTGIIKAVQRNGKPYIINYTLIEEV